MPRVIWISYLSLLVLGWMDNIRAPFFPDLIHSLHLDGTSSSLFYVSASLAAFLSSWYASRFLKAVPSLRLMKGALVLMGGGFILIAASRTFAGLLIDSTIFGIGFGFLTNAQNIIVQESAPPRWRRRIFSGLHSMYAASALLAPLTAALLLDAHMGWRRAFMGLGVLALAFFVYLQLFERSRGPTDHSHSAPSKIPAKWLWLVGFSVALYMFGEVSATSRLVLWMRDFKQDSAQTANLYLAMFCALLLVGRLSFSFLASWSNVRILCVSAWSAAVFYALGLSVHPLFLVVAGLLMSPFFPISMDHISELFGAQAPEALGFSLGLCSLMVVVLHFTLGILTDMVGLTAALWVGPAGLVAVGAMVIWTNSQRETLRNDLLASGNGNPNLRFE